MITFFYIVISLVLFGIFSFPSLVFFGCSLLLSKRCFLVDLLRGRQGLKCGWLCLRVFFRHRGGKEIVELLKEKRVLFGELNQILCVIMGLVFGAYGLRSLFGCGFCELDRNWLWGFPYWFFGFPFWLLFGLLCAVVYVLNTLWCVVLAFPFNGSFTYKRKCYSLNLC